VLKQRKQSTARARKEQGGAEGLRSEKAATAATETHSQNQVEGQKLFQAQRIKIKA
jgi:hypothetical protein